MIVKDRDLMSIQEVRDLLSKAEEGQKQLRTFTQEKIDAITEAISKAGADYAELLAKMAQEETGFGNWKDKKKKNLFAAQGVYAGIKDQKTIGVLRENPEYKTIDIGVPVGVVAGIVPSTNPTSTVIYKSMIAIKSGNAIVFSPHPNAAKCTLKAVEIVRCAAERAGCPPNCILSITTPTMEATKELMTNRKTRLILATGGGAMVRAAYSSGIPAIGVGAGNGPAYIDRSANVKEAVRKILFSKTFDNGTICASEQSIVVEQRMEQAVTEELTRQGAYFLSEEESVKLGKFILRANGTMNPEIVGKSASFIAQKAGLSSVPFSARVLIARETKVGMKAVYSHEKLAPILAFYVEETMEKAIDRCAEILMFEGAGHTFSIHCEDKELVTSIAQRMPVSRVLVNTPSALGGIGYTTGLFPALTLGCGAVGGSSSSNNNGPLDLINIKRIAWQTKDALNETVSSNTISETDSCTKEMVEMIAEKIFNRLNL